MLYGAGPGDDVITRPSIHPVIHDLAVGVPGASAKRYSGLQKPRDGDAKGLPRNSLDKDEVLLDDPRAPPTFTADVVYMTSSYPEETNTFSLEAMSKFGTYKTCERHALQYGPFLMRTLPTR